MSDSYSHLMEGMRPHYEEIAATGALERDALAAYEARINQNRQAVLEELTREAQQRGLGYRPIFVGR